MRIHFKYIIENNQNYISPKFIHNINLTHDISSYYHFNFCKIPFSYLTSLIAVVNYFLNKYRFRIHHNIHIPEAISAKNPYCKSRYESTTFIFTGKKVRIILSATILLKLSFQSATAEKTHVK